MYRSHIEEAISSIEMPVHREQIDSAITSLTNIIINAREAAVPICTSHSTINQLAPDTIAAIKHKNSLTRRWRSAAEVNTKQQIKASVNCLQKIIAQLVTRDKNANWVKFTDKLSGDNKKFWKTSKNLRGKNASMPNTIIDNGAKLTSDQSKAETLASVFEKAHQSTINQPSEMDTKVTEFANKIRSRTTQNARFNRILTDELTNVIDRLKPFKAPGNESIQNILIKNLPPAGIELLLKIFNLCLKWSNWPADFKQAKVIRIPKAGKEKNRVENYRPISLLNTIGKLLEKIVLARIVEFSDLNYIIQPEQFDFRE